MKGMPIRQAALEACRLRLRPIIMTSMAFILGVVPLLVSRGAGAEMRRWLGTTVFSGMLGVTLFGILLTPVFFVLVEWVAETALFRSRLARLIGSVTLGVFALRYVRTGVRWAGARLATGRPARIPGLRRAGIRVNGTGSDGHNGDLKPVTAPGAEPVSASVAHNGNGSSPAEEPDALIEQS